ncbi:MAG TPA: cysteine desulfurase family protein [Vicinamibacterales bacterium]|nr:cysteine desulfurase family protein [Vicinamibacterales bacterium]
MIYLDAHATTPVDPRVLDAMLPFLRDQVGNASSLDHAAGRRTRDAVDAARRQVAAVIGASHKDIVFTSGATEADNLAIKGVADSAPDRSNRRGDHIVTVATEHRAVLDTCRHLAARGCRVTVLPVGADGLIDPAAVEAALEPRTILVSVMAANNEIGVLQPLAAIGRLTRARGILFHTDAAQAFGRIPLDVNAMGIDLLSISAHKIHGPQGVGALYVRTRQPAVHLAPLFDGGGHERGLRPGTLNAPGIVGLGAASSIAATEMVAEAVRLSSLRDRLLDGLRAAIDGVHVNGSLAHRLPHNLNVSIDGADETLASRLDGLAVSAGSACASGSIEPSYVLRALGVPAARAHGTLRFGLSRFTTAAEIDQAIAIVRDGVERLRAERSTQASSVPRP